jgi:hypothetical protein
VLGIEVENIKQSCEEIVAQGFELISEIESTEDGRVLWVDFLGPDGIFTRCMNTLTLIRPSDRLPLSKSNSLMKGGTKK